MTLKWKHSFTTAKTEGTDATLVGPNEWNADHAATTDTATGMLVGRDNSGAGALQELPAIYDVAKKVWNFFATTVTGGFLLPSGSTLQRPTLPAAGTMRYNSDTGVVEVFVGGAWSLVVVGTAVPVGSTLGWYSNTAPTGFVFVNGQTVGDATSGANNFGTQFSDLFTFLWTNLADAAAPVSGGRGVSAAADFGAHKTITLPDECGRVTAGMDTMGGVATRGRLNKTTNPLGPDGTVLGDSAGEALHVNIASEAGAHGHPTGSDGTVNTGSFGTFNFTGTDRNGKTGIGGGISTPAATSSVASVSGTTLTISGTITGAFAVGQTVTGDFPLVLPLSAVIIAQLTGPAGGAGTYTLSDTIAASGPGVATAYTANGHNTVQPTIIKNTIIKY